MTTFSDFRLGKLPALNDPRQLQLANYKTAALPLPPSSKGWGQKISSWPMFKNDVLGDCTCAAVGHMEQVWTSRNAGLWNPVDKDVLDLYWATGTQDTGRYINQVLNYWRENGFGSRKSKIDAYVGVNPKVTVDVKQAIWLFGGIYVGVNLPVSAQTQKVWSVATGQNGEPGSWGGHAINITAYTSTYLTCITWGQRQTMTWGFFRKYCDEAYAILSPNWFTNQKAPSGFDYAALQADLALL